MTLDQVVTGLLYLACILVLFLLGKFIYDKLHRNFVLRVELLEKETLTKEEIPTIPEEDRATPVTA